MKWRLLPLLAGGALAAICFSVGLHRKPRYIRNFEEAEYGGDHPFPLPHWVDNGLAVYSVGTGEPVLLFPYPHGHVTHSMVQSPIAVALTKLGRTVISFDPPGAFRSTREPVGDMAEMIQCADEALARLGTDDPIDVVGHSMGGFVALAYAVERPDRFRRLVLVNSLSGFPAAARWGFPRSAFREYRLDFWRIVVWGMRLNGGRGTLALHKRLQNLMGHASYYDKSLFTPVEIRPDDANQGVPIRTIWTKNMYRRLSYAHRLDEVRVPTLILAGRHDTEAPLPCSTELLDGIPGAEMVIFEHSGHSPFVEEPERFADVLGAFLG
jgi:pimeloyl-ACP methyl ester carboxylesterase